MEGHIKLIADAVLKFAAFACDDLKIFANKEDLAEVVGSACARDAGEFAQFVEVVFPSFVFDAGGFGVGDAHKGDKLGVLSAQAGLCVGEVIGDVFGGKDVCVLGEGESDDSGVTDGIGAFIPAYVAGEDSGFTDSSVERGVEVDGAVAEVEEATTEDIFSVGAGDDESTGLCAGPDQLEVGVGTEEEVVGAGEEVIFHEQNGQGIEVSALLILIEDRKKPTCRRRATCHAKVGSSGSFAHVDQKGDSAGCAEVFSVLFDESIVGVFLDPVGAVGLIDEGEVGGDAVGLCARVGVDDADGVGAEAEVVFDGEGRGGTLQATGGDLFAAVIDEVDAKGGGAALSFDDAETLFAAGATFDLVDDAFFADQVDIGLASGEVARDRKPSAQYAVESESFPSFRESVHDQPSIQ